MQENAKKDDSLALFQDSQTRERWQWVLQAIDSAEANSERDLKSRSDQAVAHVNSPFSE